MGLGEDGGHGLAVEGGVGRRWVRGLYVCRGDVDIGVCCGEIGFLKYIFCMSRVFRKSRCHIK